MTSQKSDNPQGEDARGDEGQGAAGFPAADPGGDRQAEEGEARQAGDIGHGQVEAGARGGDVEGRRAVEPVIQAVLDDGRVAAGRTEEKHPGQFLIISRRIGPEPDRAVGSLFDQPGADRRLKVPLQVARPGRLQDMEGVVAAQHEIGEGDAEKDGSAEFHDKAGNRAGHSLGDFGIEQAGEDLDVEGDGEISPLHEFRVDQAAGNGPSRQLRGIQAAMNRSDKRARPPARLLGSKRMNGERGCFMLRPSSPGIGRPGRQEMTAAAAEIHERSLFRNPQIPVSS